MIITYSLIVSPFLKLTSCAFYTYFFDHLSISETYFLCLLHISIYLFNDRRQRFPTHTFTDDEVAKIKSLAAERQSRPIDNDDDIHAGFEVRFPTHTFTPEEVAKIKSLAAERRKNITNDDDIHAGFEMRFPTHTYTDDEVEKMKAEAEDRKKKREEVVNNDDDIHAGFEMRFPTHTYTEDEVHEMEADAAKRKTEKVLKDFFPQK